MEGWLNNLGFGLLKTMIKCNTKSPENGAFVLGHGTLIVQFWEFGFDC